MSCATDITILSGCGGNPYPFTATPLEPLKWDERTITYDTVAGEERPILICYFMRNVLQFRHVIEYDAAGDEIRRVVE